MAVPGSSVQPIRLLLNWTYKLISRQPNHCNRFPLLQALNSQSRPYSEEVIEHFQRPRNVGKLDDKKSNVGTAIVGKAACADMIKLQIEVDDGVIVDAKFKAFGCGSAIASSSYATEIIKGKTCEEALKLKNTAISDHLKLPPVKLHCSLLAEDAVKYAINDYIKKNEMPKTIEVD